MADADRYVSFRNLHETGCFVIPNPWDAGTARVLALLGFPALATTSSGAAWANGRRDHGVTLEAALAHFRTIAESVPVPVNADFEGGFAGRPEDVDANVARAVATRRLVDRRLHPGPGTSSVRIRARRRSDSRGARGDRSIRRRRA